LFEEIVEGVGDGIHGEGAAGLGLTEAGEIGGNDAMLDGERGKLVPPDGLVERKAVEENEWNSAALVGVVPVELADGLCGHAIIFPFEGRDYSVEWGMPGGSLIGIVHRLQSLADGRS
jgi:hypothetical protein